MRHRAGFLSVCAALLLGPANIYSQTAQAHRGQEAANYVGNVTFEADMTALINNGFMPGIDSIGIMMNLPQSLWSHPIPMAPLPGDSDVYSVTVNLNTPTTGDSNYVYWKLYGWGGRFGINLNWEISTTGPGWDAANGNRYFIFDGVDTAVGPVSPNFRLPNPSLDAPSNGSFVPPSPTFSWSFSSTGVPVELEISTDSSFAATNLSVLVFPPDTSLAHLDSLSGNTKYFWRVARTDSAYLISRTWSFITLPQAPAALIATPGNDRITLEWQDSLSPNNSTYLIYRRTTSLGLILLDSVASLSYVDSEVTNGTTYFYEVKAGNSEHNTGPASLEVSATPFNSPPHPSITSDQNTYEPNSGSSIYATINFSNTGSYDTDGTIDSIFWYVNGKQVGRLSQLTYSFRQGTDTVKLVVEDNQGAKDSTVSVIDRSKFKFFLRGPVYAGPSLLGDDVLFVIGSGDAVYRADTSGNEVYSLQVGGDVKSSSSIAYDTTVYIASSDKNLYSFSKFGTSQWPALPLGGVMTSTPAVDSLSNSIYVGISNNNFFAVNRTAGKVAWNYFVDAPIVGCAAITLDRKLVFASVKGTIYGFDLAHLTSSPSPAWQLALSDSIYGSPAVDDSGNAYFASASGKVYCITLPRSGPASIVWQAQTGAAMTASPVIDGFGTIYVGASDGKLYAIDGRSGNIKWAYSTGAPIYSTATISNVNMIYVGNHAGKVCALDTSSTLHWYYQDSSSVDAPLLYHNGTLYVGTTGGRLIAFFDDADSTLHSAQKSSKLKTVASVAPVPVWGTFQGNNQRTGLPVGHTVTEVRNLKAFVPRSFALYQNYPNPFNPSTTIRFDLKVTSEVTLEIFNVLGQRVISRDYGRMSAGSYSRQLNMDNFASGVYFYLFRAVGTSGQTFQATKKMLLMK